MVFSEDTKLLSSMLPECLLYLDFISAAANMVNFIGLFLIQPTNRVIVYIGYVIGSIDKSILPCIAFLCSQDFICLSLRVWKLPSAAVYHPVGHTRQVFVVESEIIIQASKL